MGLFTHKPKTTDTAAATVTITGQELTAAARAPTAGEQSLADALVDRAGRDEDMRPSVDEQ
ncbi:hypothetical protein [Streptomyces roseolilacinus]|uniref:hypothetical protein n=1 Tax=Streptomyces roseolilacinus TaxID=66904 RepID=UPI00380A3116